MNGIKFSRRGFLKAGCLTATAVAAPKFFFDAYAQDSGKVLVNVFLRGGFDGLNFLVPLSGADRDIYYAARPTIGIPVGELLQLEGTSAFGLHPSAQSLQELFNQANSPLAIVRSIGLTEPNLSHFDAQNKIDLGIVKSQDLGIGTGFLTRAYAESGGTFDMPLLAACGNTPLGISGLPTAVTMANPSTFSLNSHTGNKWQDVVDVATSDLWAGPEACDDAGTNAFHVMGIVDDVDGEFAGDQPPGHYSTLSAFGLQLDTVFRTIKGGLCTYAQVDKNGWDCHSNQGGALGDGGINFFADMVSDLSLCLAGFFDDLRNAGLADKVTVMVYSEFGRRVEDNSSGTDHGRGGVALALGQRVNGGKLYGQWNGLNALDDGNIPVHHDYRQLFSEVLLDQKEIIALQNVFPGYNYTGPIGGGTGIFKTG